MKPYTSFNQIAASFGTETPLFSLLKEREKYLAHTEKGKPNETLEEHMKLVIQYFLKLVNAHGLDSVVDRLIEKAIPKDCEENLDVGNFIKGAFFKVILYHDFGKVNHAFQWDKTKMANTRKDIKVVKHKVGSQHSIISAYIYLVHLLDNDLGFEGATQTFTDFMLIALSYSIVKHHSARLSKVEDIDFQGNVDAFREYLTLFNTPEPESVEDLHDIFDSSDSIRCSLEQFHENLQTNNFAVYSLLKLNFSLLTASDYYATGEYSQGTVVDDFGLAEGNLREHIIDQFKTSESYNKELFEKPEKLQEVSFDDLQERNNTNLNKLRQKLASEALLNLRKNREQSLFYLEAPTGAGKTNVSLALITELLETNPELNKVFYVFPFTTLVTQTFDAIKETLQIKNEHLIQLHAKSGFHQQSEEPNDGNYGTYRMNFLNNHFINYPITLLTHIKFFNVLKGNKKDNNYIFHRLANSVVVLDELQTYAPKHWDKVVYFLSQFASTFNMKVILMSATLPKIDELLDEKSLKGRFTHLIERENKKLFFQNPNFAGRVEFDFTLLDEFGWKRPKSESEREEFTDRLIEKVLQESESYISSHSKDSESVRVLIEFITKKSASQFFNRIKESAGFDDYTHYLISGEILNPRRQQIIDNIKNNQEEKVILVTTQVVEAGVDIDMDLGFKDRSLIDSDEQLAGRVNRNAKKEGCKVFMFDYDSTAFIYKGDKRLKVEPMQERQAYQEILKTKDFDTLFYQQVNAELIRLNQSNATINFSDYLSNLENLDFGLVDSEFQLIEQDNESIFVPLPIPKEHFSKEDLSLLKKMGISEYSDEDNELSISGEDVWNAYKDLITREKGDYINDQIELKQIYGLLSKFMFSAFENQVKLLKEYCDNGDGFEDYKMGGLHYLLNWEQVYSYEGGVNMNSIEDDGAFL